MNERHDVDELRATAASMRRVRWIGAAFAVLQFTLYQPPPGIVPPFPMLPVGLLVAGILATANIASLLSTRSGDPRLLLRSGRAELAADAAVITAIAWLFAFDITSALWALLVVPVLEGALRAQMRGAVITWGAVAVAYLARDLWAAQQYDYAPFLIESVTYRMGIVGIVALTAGYLANNLVEQNERRQRERAAFEAELEQIAFHDPLTGLPNRALFMDRLDHALKRAAREGTTTAVLFLDLDRFKLINDSLGHGAGDNLLVAVARRLVKALRPGDTVARFGGDEFAVLCEAVHDRWDASSIAERIRDAFSAPFRLAEGDMFVTTSIGIAVASGTDDTPQELLRDADAAMYRAKERGRSGYEIFDEAMRSRVVNRLQTENDLHRAIERGEFRLAFQPLVRLSTGEVEGVEALVRWDHPDRGVVMPHDFISLAEDTGLIVPIGAWVIEEACRWSERWREQFPDRRPLSVAVNLSARQLAKGSLLDTVRDALRATNTDPVSLCLEITESLVMEDAEFITEALIGLKALGVRLGIDDFGTGYSSLAYLKRLPVDLLKVDRTFVKGLGSDPEDAAIVEAVIGLAHARRLVVIGEGVETDKQLGQLKLLGCDLAQGTFLSHPLDGEQISMLLAQGNRRGAARIATAAADRRDGLR